MKDITTKRRKKRRKTLVFIVFLLFIQSIAFSQNQVEVIVRLNHHLLDFKKIDDQTLLRGSLDQFLNNEGKKILANSNCLTLQENKWQKIFSNLKTYDSISIGRFGNEVSIPPFWATFKTKVPSENYYRIREELEKSYPLVIYAHQNPEVEWLSTPDDSIYSEQKSLYDPIAGIKADEAWDIETGKPYIKVGVFDTGIDTGHVDLNNVVTGYLYDDQSPADTNLWGADFRNKFGHGTLCAGIIGASRNNNIGIAGVAGGDGDSLGVSLIDFRILARDPNVTGDMIARAVIDGARKVGTYYDWSLAFNTNGTPNPNYWQNASGFGIHIGNHSYGLRILNPLQNDTLSGGKINKDNGGIDEDGDGVPDGPNPGTSPEDCFLCREAFLFSLQNGVTNIVASGNAQASLTPQYYTDPTKVPQNYDDSWLIITGGTGEDGNYFIGSDGDFSWLAQANKNMDIAAPCVQNLVYTTVSNDLVVNDTLYRKTSGTSFSAPHAAGVAALLLSKYNQNCYSNSNLDPADIEYILEHSATDVSPLGYDDSTGYGRLNAKKALDMIDFPTYQIIHPDTLPVAVNMVEMDTITLFLNTPLYSEAQGPISSSYPLENQRYYKVERYKYEVTYDFSQYLLPSTQIIDVWTRPSVTNLLQKFDDVVFGTAGFFERDTFIIEPFTEIGSIFNGNITLRGFNYRFFEQYDNVNFPDANDGITSVNYWYPRNPNTDDIRAGFSVYLKDSLAPFYLQPCYASQSLVDSVLEIQSDFSNLVTLYPNPSIDVFNIINHSKYDVSSIIVFTITGEKLFETQHHKINLNSLSNGTYIVSIDLSNGNKVFKKILKL